MVTKERMVSMTEQTQAEVVRAVELAWSRGGRDAVEALADRSWVTPSDPSPEVAAQLARLLLQDSNCAAVLIEMGDESGSRYVASRTETGATVFVRQAERTEHTTLPLAGVGIAVLPIPRMVESPVFGESDRALATLTTAPSVSLVSAAPVVAEPAAPRAVRPTGRTTAAPALPVGSRRGPVPGRVPGQLARTA